MLIKQKSLIVAIVSSFVIALVLVLTLVGYLAYIELKGEEFKRSYQELLQKANAKVYSRHIEISKLKAKIETSGVLKGKPIIEGVLKNKGPRDITNMMVNIKFLDKDSAVLYEEIFNPREPSLGTSGLSLASIPYLSGTTKIFLKQNESLPFKKILVNCPKEIVDELRSEDRSSVHKLSKWSGKLTFEILSISF